MGNEGAKVLAITVLLSLLIGIGVLVLDDDYTIEKNIASNEDYCPTIQPAWAGPIGDGAAAAEHGEVE